MTNTENNENNEAVDQAIRAAQSEGMAFTINWDEYEAAVKNVAFHAGVSEAEAWRIVEDGPTL